MTAQPRVLPSTQALITDDTSGGFIQITDMDDVNVHVDMLTAQGRDCTVWVRRTPLTDTAAELLAGPALDSDGDEGMPAAWVGGLR